MDGAVAERGRERLVDAAMLVDEREPVEVGADDRHLEMIAGPRAVVDSYLSRAGERLLEQRADRVGLHIGHGSDRGYAGAVRLFRSLLVFKLGFWAGMLGSAALLKRVLRSVGDAESHEVALVAIFDGIELESRAKSFRGGSMFTWFGGIAVDLREATLAPGAHLTLNTLWGGIAIRVPPEWQVESSAKALGGGVAIRPPQIEVPDAPRLTIDGIALLGGIAVGSKTTDEPATT